METEIHPLRRFAENVISTLVGITHGMMVEGLPKARAVNVLMDAMEHGDDWEMPPLLHGLLSRIVTDWERDMISRRQIGRVMRTVRGVCTELAEASETEPEAIYRTFIFVFNAAAATKLPSMTRKSMLGEVVRMVSSGELPATKPDSRIGYEIHLPVSSDQEDTDHIVVQGGIRIIP